jgi:ABC-2 type transport system permease protein
MSATSAVARRAFGDARARTASFALLLAFAAAAQVIGYRSTYPTLADRVAFAQSFGDNAAIRLFYGVPRDLLTVGGYAGWRVGGFMSLFAAVWGVLAAVRAFRTEEDSGRLELVLAAPVHRRRIVLASLAAIAAGACVLWLATFIALAASRLPVGGSAYLALTVTSPVPVFVGVGALASQVAPNRRLALGLSLAVMAIAFALRVIADTVSGLGWLRWTTPLGWVEELRPFAHPDPWVIALHVASAFLLLLPAIVISARRDVGAGLVRLDDSSDPRFALLSSPLLQALRSELGALSAWVAGVGGLALIMGLISNSFSSGLSASLRQRLEQVGGGSLMTPTGVLAFYFLFFALVISLFAAAQIVAARREEAEQRLETLFALPVSRQAWFLGRIVLAMAGALGLAIAAAVLAWAGAASQHAGVGLGGMLEAGVNCLPAVFLLLGLAALGFASLPRASSVIAYGPVVVAFLWELLGAVLGAPRWALGLSPFHHLGLVPIQPVRPLPACTMLAIAAAVIVVAVVLFGRRDLTNA